MGTFAMDTIYFADGIGQQFADVATGGPIVLGLLAAALAGLVSFASPCVIPLVPGYVSYLTGISGASGAQGNGVTTGVADATSVDKHDGDGGRGQRSSTARVGLTALLFVLGFTVIFVLGSASIFGLVSTLRLQARTLTIVGGVVTIVMGLAFMGMVPALQKDTRMAPKRWTTWLGAPLLGAVFALGWTPCLGPTLTAIISVSAGTQGMTAAWGWGCRSFWWRWGRHVRCGEWTSCVSTREPFRSSAAWRWCWSELPWLLDYGMFLLPGFRPLLLLIR